MVKRFLTRPVTLKNVKVTEEDDIVQNGLAVTPAQMYDMAERGIPITPANLGLTYQEGVSKLDFETPMEYTRGVDIADMWEHREDMKKRMKSDKFTNLLKTESNE